MAFFCCFKKTAQFTTDEHKQWSQTPGDSNAITIGDTSCINMEKDSSVTGQTKTIGRDDPPREIGIKLLLIGTIITNPLCVPLVWYILRGYKERWNQGLHNVAMNCMKRAILTFAVGVLLTVCLIIALLTIAFHGHAETHNFQNDGYSLKKTGNRYNTKRPLDQTNIISSTNFTALLEDSRIKALGDVQIENDDKGGSKFYNIDIASKDAKIKFHNETFIKICVELKGCEVLKVPEGFGQDRG